MRWLFWIIFCPFIGGHRFVSGPTFETKKNGVVDGLRWTRQCMRCGISENVWVSKSDPWENY